MASIPVELNLDQMRNYLYALDQRGLVYHFTVSPANEGVRLNLVVDGKDDPLEIWLGIGIQGRTWKASHQIEFPK